MRHPTICTIACLLVTVHAARAEVLEFNDKAVWTAAAGCFTTIGFAGFADSTHITDQYAQLGILFVDSYHYIDCCIPDLPDGAGLTGAPGIHVVFLTPQSVLGVDSANLQIQLFSGGSLTYTSGVFKAQEFAGLLSSEPFDSAVLIDPFTSYPRLPSVSIDDLHFGGPIFCGDLDGDGSIGIVDFLILLGDWGACPAVPDPCAADVDHDGMVGVTDLLLLLSHWS